MEGSKPLALVGVTLTLASALALIFDQPRAVWLIVASGALVLGAVVVTRIWKGRRADASVGQGKDHEPGEQLPIHRRHAPQLSALVTVFVGSLVLFVLMEPTSDDRPPPVPNDLERSVSLGYAEPAEGDDLGLGFTGDASLANRDLSGLDMESLEVIPGPNGDVEATLESLVGNTAELALLPGSASPADSTRCMQQTAWVEELSWDDIGDDEWVCIRFDHGGETRFGAVRIDSMRFGGLDDMFGFEGIDVDGVEVVLTARSWGRPT